ncbi:MAG: PAS domain S-box protein [Gammaproteobacteria bacterium]|nr:PAS domain S-box protein [Gammaproteobacteria bacterium]
MSATTPDHSRFFWRSTAMFCVLDFDGNFKEVNSAWERVLGLSTGQLLAKPYVDFVHTDDQPSTKYYLEQMAEGMVSASFSNRFRHRDGSYRQLLWEVTAAASQEYAFYAVALDITARERPSISDEMVSVLDEGVVLQYANGTIGACNPSAERIIGLPVDQMIGWTLIDPEWRAIREDGSPFPSATHPAICTLRTGQPYSDVVLGVEKTDGSVVWLRINTYPLWRDDVTTPYAVVISFSDITQYKATEQALRQGGAGEPQTPSISREVDYDLWDWNLDTNAVAFSERWKQMLGYSETDVFNHVDAWYERIHPLEYKRVLADVQNHIEGQTPHFENTHRLQHKDGSYRWVLCRGVVVHDTNGKATRVIGMHADVTDQQHAEDKVQEYETKYQQLMDVESDAIFLVDGETDKIVEANKAASQIYGYNRKEILTLTHMDLSAQAEKSGKAVKKLTKFSKQRHHKKKDGSVFRVEMTVTPFIQQGHEMSIIIVRDITEQQKVETALWESQSKYRQLFEAASNATVVFDANTQQIFDVNNVAVEMYGYTKEEWLQLTTEDISAETSKSRTAFHTANKKQIIPLRWHKKRDSTIFPVEISTGSSYLFQGRSLVCATLRDITERRAAEDALRKERDFVNTLVQASPAFFFALNPDGKIRMMNKAMLEALGYTEKEVADKDFLTNFIPEEERSVASAEFETLTKSMRPSLTESHVLTKGEEPILVEWHSRAIVQANGILDYLFSVGIDVTERSEAQGHQRLFKAIIEASEEAITISDADNQLIYINPAHEKMFSRTLQEARAGAHDYYPPESQEILRREVEPALGHGESWTGELEVMDANEETFPIWERADAVRDASGNILYRFELMHNISERKRMWETLRSQWEEYQAIFNAVPVMIWHRDKENRLLRANELATKKLDLARENQEFYAENLMVINSGQPKLGVVESYPGLKDEKIWLQTGRIPYRDKSDEILGVIVFAVDVTEYRKVETRTATGGEQLRIAVENLPMMLVAFDKNGNVVGWNKESALVTGYRASEVISKPGAADMLYTDENCRQQMDTDSDFHKLECVINCKDGTQKPAAWTNISRQFPIRGWHRWYIGQDLSKHKKKESELPKDEAMLPFIFNATKLGICVTDDRGRFVKVNQAYADLYGYNVEELIGQPFTLTLPSKSHDEAIRDYFSLMITNEEPTITKHMDEQRRDGRHFDAEVMANRVILADGRRLLMTILTEVVQPE